VIAVLRLTPQPDSLTHVAPKEMTSLQFGHSGHRGDSEMKHSLFSKAVVVSALCLAVPGYALDLTGTWEGKESCSLFNGTSSKTKQDVTVTITQSGYDLNLNISGGFLSGLYNGVSLGDVADLEKGQAGAYRCGLSASGSQAGSFTAKTDLAAGTGKLKGRLIYLQNDMIEQGVTTCKYSLKLTNPMNPAVGACPP
jgi:hypothetical protein